MGSRQTWTGLSATAIALALLSVAAPAHAGITFTVNDSGDAADAIIDGTCATAGAVCTLRAAIQEANAQAGADTIQFAPSVTGQILLTSPLPVISEDVSIVGPGAGLLAVDGANAYRVFELQNGTTSTISDLTIRDGLAPVSGGSTFANAGGILSGGTLTLDHVVVSGNHATLDGAVNSIIEALGAGIEAGGTLTIKDSTVQGNIAQADASGTGQSFSAGGGIALDASATLHVDHSLVDGNQAVAIVNSGSSSSTTRPNGGGIYQAGGTMTIDESTITGNTASGAGGTDSSIADFAEGGGVYQDNSSSLTVTGSTISSNTVVVPAGAHEFTAGSDFQLLVGGTFADTIVADGIGGANCGQGTFTSNGYNLDDANSCGFNQATDIVNQDPALQALANNGGPTLTEALGQGSPAIDQGKSFGATTDQRDTGFARIQDFPSVTNAAGGDGSDIGAFEAPPPVATVSVWLAMSPGTAQIDIQATLLNGHASLGSAELDAISPAGAGPGGSALEQVTIPLAAPLAPPAKLKLVLATRMSCASPDPAKVTLYFGTQSTDSTLAATGLGSTLHFVGKTLAAQAGHKLTTKKASAKKCTKWGSLGNWSAKLSS